MDNLVTVAWLWPEPLRGDAREPSAWIVNPLVHATFAARAAKERAAREKAKADMAESIRTWRGTT